nr:MAG: hypothetical protein DIU68_02820 [Chloroflexota bacterium]
MTIMDILAWLLVIAIHIGAFPWAVWLSARLNHGRPELAMTTALTLTASAGALTLAMFWLSLAGLPLTVPLITFVYLLLMLPGWLAWQRLGFIKPPLRSATGPYAVPVLLIAAIAAAVVFNAVYWPFSRDDALGIYHAQASAIARSGALLPLTGSDSLYLTYPAMMPLAYAFTYLASGWENEYLARLLPALYSLGAVLAAYMLGREAADRQTGWLAALLLALAPTFGRWASAGYVDLPMAFFYTLSACFALRVWHGGQPGDAVAAVALQGKAAWAKNPALIGAPVGALWFALALARRRMNWQSFFAGLVACALIAAPWYLRNLAGAGFLVPPTAWTDQARPTLDNLLLFVTRPEIYSLSGWAFAFGLLYAIERLMDQRRQTETALLLMLWTLPFFAAWWLFTSYDPRLLLPVLPAFSVMGAMALRWLWQSIPKHLKRPAYSLALLVAIALAILAAWNSVEFKDDILKHPLMSDAEKRAIIAQFRDEQR